jgi:hypothetical protein
VAAAGGFEPPHPESCPIGPTAIVRHEEWQQIVSQTPSRRVHDLSSPQGTTAVKPAGHKFLMQRFESCRPSRPVRLQRVLKRTALEMPRYRDNAGMVREDGVGNSRSISRLPTAAYFWAAATDRHDLCVAERLFGVLAVWIVLSAALCSHFSTSSHVGTLSWARKPFTVAEPDIELRVPEA